MNLDRLNTGLVRMASVRSYPVQRRHPLPRRTSGRVFRIGVLHSKEMTEAMLERNRRGFVNSQVNTAAHAPSLYHWLFHRCGIAFAEAQALAGAGALRVSGEPVAAAALERQTHWADFARLDVCLRAGPDALWAPALKRALHRQYLLLFAHPGLSITSDRADPRSFVHRVTPLVGSTAAIGMNVLRPIGFMNGMRGIVLATNDVSMVRYWNNECLGNYGVYDVRFRRGVPGEVLRGLAASVQSELDARVRPIIPPDVAVPCACDVDKAGPARWLQTLRGELHSERIVVRTPLLPYRCAKRIRRAGGIVTMTRAGPFALPPGLPEAKMRPLTQEELAVMFTFERRLKTNRLVLSLREFDADKDEVEMPQVN